MTVVKNKPGRGRPRAFDRADVLHRAMEVFWAVGYEAASVPRLSQAMGISVQSLYAAYGSKDALYVEALELYRATIGGFGARALAEEPDALFAVSRLLREAATNFASQTGAPGCMITMAPAETEQTPLTILGRRLRAESVEKITERLQRGQREGQVRPDIDPAVWARFVVSIVQGMSVQARDGVAAETLNKAADIAVSSLSVLRP